MTAQPVGGLFSFYLPPPRAPPTARERFDLDLPTETDQLAKLTSADALAPPLDDTTYVTPRQSFREKSKANVAPAAISKDAKAGSRVKGFAAFFEQFSEALSA